MKIQTFVSTIMVSSFLCLMFSFAYADQEVVFSDESAAKEILVGNSWTCEQSDQFSGAPTTWTFEEVKGKKVRGFIPWCSDKATIKGKLKKNKMKYSISHPSDNNCNTSGELKFYRKDNGSVYAEGSYTYVGPYSSGKKGKIHQCYKN